MPVTWPGPNLNLYRGFFQLKLSLHYGIVHREVFQLRIAGELTGTASLLYEYLTFNCDVKSGIVHPLTVSQVARALRVHRRTVELASHRLKDLALLSPDDTGNCLSGSLPHVKDASAGRTQPASLREARTPTPGESRARRASRPEQGGDGTVSTAQVLEDGLPFEGSHLPVSNGNHAGDGIQLSERVQGYVNKY